MAASCCFAASSCVSAPSVAALGSATPLVATNCAAAAGCCTAAAACAAAAGSCPCVAAIWLCCCCIIARSRFVVGSPARPLPSTPMPGMCIACPTAGAAAMAPPVPAAAAIAAAAAAVGAGAAPMPSPTPCGTSAAAPGCMSPFACRPESPAIDTFSRPPVAPTAPASAACCSGVASLEAPRVPPRARLATPPRTPPAPARLPPVRLRASSSSAGGALGPTVRCGGMSTEPYLRSSVEFQWFLMALSVRPSSFLAMLAHLFPYTLCQRMMVMSSSSVNGCLFTAGLSWLHQRSRQLLLDRFGKLWAISDQLRAPCLATSSRS